MFWTNSKRQHHNDMGCSKTHQAFDQLVHVLSHDNAIRLQGRYSVPHPISMRASTHTGRIRASRPVISQYFRAGSNEGGASMDVSVHYECEKQPQISQDIRLTRRSILLKQDVRGAGRRRAIDVHSLLLLQSPSFTVLLFTFTFLSEYCLQVWPSCSGSSCNSGS